MFWIVLILLLLAFGASESGRAIIAIGIVSLAIFLIAKLTGFSILEQIPKWGLVAIIVIASGAILAFLFQDC